MSTFHLINVWRDQDAPGFLPMPHSLLWLPDDFILGQPRPAFIFLHSWGGYPHDDLPQTLGSALADRGFGFLSLCLRRRGGEGQLVSMPDNDPADVRLAVDYLVNSGFSDIYLIGEEAGCHTAVHYAAQSGDPRVKGLCLVDPVADLPDWLADSMGQDEYQALVQEAAVAARQGAGMDYRIDCISDEGPMVMMQAMPFLAWWGPAARARTSVDWPAVHIPVLLFAESETALPEYLRTDPATVPRLARHFGSREQLVDLLSEGVWHLNGDPIDSTGLELVNVEVSDRSLYGFLWSPADSAPVDTAVVLVHGLTSSPTSPLFLKMAPVLAQEVHVLAVETHRSGWAGHETALLDDELEDLDAWLELLQNRGIRRVILAGASMGSLSVCRYAALRDPDAVAGVAHLMPTADCPQWFEAAAGSANYHAMVATAREAVAAGTGDSFLVDIDVRQPPPSLSRGRFRWTQRAASWLSWWGPDADSVNSKHIANVRVPLLLASGTADSYNDTNRFRELRQAAVSAPSVDEIWYEDIDHGLAGVEEQVAADLLKWLQQRCQ